MGRGTGRPPGRPSKAQKAALRGMAEADYAALEKACVQAFLLGESHVILALSHMTKLADDFPNTTIVKREPSKIHVKVRANRLLAWLNKHGYTAFTSEDIRVAQIRFTSMKEKVLALQEFDWPNPELDRG